MPPNAQNIIDLKKILAETAAEEHGIHSFEGVTGCKTDAKIVAKLSRNGRQAPFITLSHQARVESSGASGRLGTVKNGVEKRIFIPPYLGENFV